MAPGDTKPGGRTDGAEFGSGTSGGEHVHEGQSTDDREEFHDADSIDVVRFNVPAYTGKLRSWFTRLEAQFRAGKVKTESVKFNVVIAQAPEHMIEKLSDPEIARLALDKKCYEKLKEFLIQKFTPSEDERFANLMKDMGVHSNERPSDVYRAVEREAEGILPAEVVKKMWLLKLPLIIQMLLLKEKLPIAELTVMADEYFLRYKNGNLEMPVDAVHHSNPFLQPPPTNPAPVVPPADPVASLAAAVERLSAQVCALETRGRQTSRQGAPRHSRNNRSRGNFRSGSRRRASTPARPGNATPGRNETAPQLCWYHRSWGENATQCRAPCSFSGN